MGKALGGGSGWVVLTRSPRDGRAGQRLGGRPHAQPGRRHAAAGARHVRARLSPRLRQPTPRPMSMPSWRTSPGRASPRASPAKRGRPSPHTVDAPTARAMLDADPDLLVIDARLRRRRARPCRSRLRGARRAPPDKVDEVAASPAQGREGAGLLRLGLRDRRRLRRASCASAASTPSPSPAASAPGAPTACPPNRSSEGDTP